MTSEMFNVLVKRIEKLEEKVLNIKNVNERNRLEDFRQMYEIKVKELDAIEELICDIEDNIDIFEEDSETY